MLVRRSEPVSSSVAGLIATPGTTSHASWKRRFVVTGTEVSASLLMFTDSPARSGSTIGDSTDDGDGLGDGPDGQREVDVEHAVEPDRLLADHRLEAGELGLHVVGRRREVGDAVDPVGVGDRGELSERFRALQRDRDARQDRAARIDDFPAHRPGRGALSGCRARRQEQHDDDHEPHEYRHVILQGAMPGRSKVQVVKDADGARRHVRAGAGPADHQGGAQATDRHAAPEQLQVLALQRIALVRRVDGAAVFLGDAGRIRCPQGRYRCWLSSVLNAVRPSADVVTPAMPTASPDQNRTPFLADGPALRLRRRLLRRRLSGARDRRMDRLRLLRDGRSRRQRDGHQHGHDAHVSLLLKAHTLCRIDRQRQRKMCRSMSATRSSTTVSQPGPSRPTTPTRRAA